MIEKIKDEIEKIKEVEEAMSPTLYSKGTLDAYQDCLKWAEELKKELKESIRGITFYNSEQYHKLADIKIEKAFHGGSDKND